MGLEPTNGSLDRYLLIGEVTNFDPALYDEIVEHFNILQ